ncbi:TPA: DUF551 domain-containing protein [Escherichia coli]|nr:DUF551 domain-containing protein [Escherichia coli]
MTTITRENAEIKSFITGFLSDPAHDNQSSSSLLANVFRIALASLEAEPVAWMRDDADGREYNARNEFSGGGGGIPLYATPQVQVVPEEMYWQDAPVEGSSKAAAYATGWNDCREAMLQSGNFRENKDSSTNNFRKIPEASTSSPVTPDGWISCSERMPEIRQTVIGWNGYAVRQCVYTRNGYAKTQKGREPRFETLTGIWHGVTHWMPLPEPPQEVK